MKDAKSPQSSSTFQGLTNAVSLFIEIRGIGWEKRVLPVVQNVVFWYPAVF